MLFKDILSANPPDFELQRKVDFSFSVQWLNDIIMRRVYPAIFLFFLSTVSAKSQSVKGKLLDLIENTALAGATVQISELKDSTDKLTSVSDSKGLFQFKNLTTDSFLLKISFVGYAEYRQFFTLTDSLPDIDLGTLFIPKKTKDLDVVTIT